MADKLTLEQIEIRPMNIILAGPQDLNIWNFYMICQNLKQKTFEEIDSILTETDVFTSTQNSFVYWSRQYELLKTHLFSSGGVFFSVHCLDGIHPAHQPAFLELLAILANKGITVFTTTYSPYVLHHLNTLLMGEPEIAEQQAEFLCLRNKDAFLSIEDVSAYEMLENGYFKSLKREIPKNVRYDHEQIIWNMLSISPQIDSGFAVGNLLKQYYDEQSAPVDAEFADTEVTCA